MDDAQLLDYLEACEMLRDVGAGACQALAAAATERCFDVGETLFRRGEPRQAFFVVIDGEVEVHLEGGPHAHGETVLLGRGAAVGESGLLEPGVHAATAVARAPTRLLEMPLAAVRDQLAGDGAAALSLFHAVSRLMVRRLQYAASRRVGWSHAYGAGDTRTEHDLLGEREVPANARYGVQTLRATENFPITGVPVGHFPSLVRALAAVKQAAVRANRALDLLPDDVAGAIDRACQEILDGHWHGHLVVDVIQGGAGTSTNMNANEVIANRALELLGHPRGAYEHCHPNNHVNLSQSTNDVYPTAIKIAAVLDQRNLGKALAALSVALRAKATDFADVLKMGRTQLQDAVPMTVAQEFEAFAVTIDDDVRLLRDSAEHLLEINLGGTAIGTGVNAHPDYRDKAVRELGEITGLRLVSAPNLIEATSDTGAFVSFSGVLKRIAVKLGKVCNDLRLLSSGPRCGLGELHLPARQPGSSIMPGKVNPVIPEVVNQVAFQVIGNDLAITLAAEAGQLQLNVMEPLIAYKLFESLNTLTAAVQTLTDRCIVGIEVDRKRCAELVERAVGVVTAVVPVLGYERASRVAKEALATGCSVREILARDGDLSPSALDELLSPGSMLAPRWVDPA